MGFLSHILGGVMRLLMMGVLAFISGAITGFFGRLSGRRSMSRGDSPWSMLGIVVVQLAQRIPWFLRARRGTRNRQGQDAFEELIDGLDEVAADPHATREEREYATTRLKTLGVDPVPLVRD